MENKIILYNDACPVCSLEIEHYRSMSAKYNAPLFFEKISDQGFVLSESQLTVDDAKRKLHVRSDDGTLYVGVDAFLAIWETLPFYRQLGRIVAIPGIYQIAQFLYGYVLAPMLFKWDQRRSDKV